MIEKIGALLIGIGLCGYVALETVKYLHPRGFTKKPEIDPDFDFNEFIVS